MDFARQQLEKYGWREGSGLGKNEDGISSAIKPNLKFDKYGLGHDAGEEYTNNWWETLFNKAAQNVKVSVDDDQQVNMEINSNKSFEISTKPTNDGSQFKKELEYGSFIKTAKLTGNSVEKFDNVPQLSQELNNFSSLTDEQLFAACGGRTAHKGARHGLKLNGKLSRIEKQEKMLLKKMRKVSLSDSEKDDNNTQKKLKKLKKHKENSEKVNVPEGNLQSTSNLKKKKKKRKSVSFNETVTKIYTVDLDTSFGSEVGSMKDENSNDPCLENLASGSDEGIELDNDNDNSNHLDNHKSFEVVQCKYSDLSKAERKKLKKKRKLEARRYNSTGIFLQRLKDESNEDYGSMNDYDNKEINMKKRKFFEESEQGDSKISFSVTESPDKNRSKRHKKKRKKQRKIEEKQLNNIVKSFDICSISKNE